MALDPSAARLHSVLANGIHRENCLAGSCTEDAQSASFKYFPAEIEGLSERQGVVSRDSPGIDTLRDWRRRVSADRAEILAARIMSAQRNRVCPVGDLVRNT